MNNSGDRARVRKLEALRQRANCGDQEAILLLSKMRKTAMDVPYWVHTKKRFVNPYWENELLYEPANEKYWMRDPLPVNRGFDWISCFILAVGIPIIFVIAYLIGW